MATHVTPSVDMKPVAISPQTSLSDDKQILQSEVNVLRLIQELRTVAKADIRAGLNALTNFAVQEGKNALALGAACLKLEHALDLAKDQHTPETLEAYESLLDKADDYLCKYREAAPKHTLLGWQSQESDGGHWLGLAMVAMEFIQGIADELGLWITWFDDSEEYKPKNYWRESIQGKVSLAN